MLRHIRCENREIWLEFKAYNNSFFMYLFEWSKMFEHPSQYNMSVDAGD